MVCHFGLVIILQARWRRWRESLKCWEKRRVCFVEGEIVLVLYLFLSVRSYRCKCIYVHAKVQDTPSLSFSLSPKFLPLSQIFILCLYIKLPFKFALVGHACKRGVACSRTENRLSIRPSPHFKIPWLAIPTVAFFHFILLKILSSCQNCCPLIGMWWHREGLSGTEISRWWRFPPCIYVRRLLVCVVCWQYVPGPRCIAIIKFKYHNTGWGLEEDSLLPLIRRPACLAP